MQNSSLRRTLLEPTADDVNFKMKKRDRKNTGSGVIKAKRLARKAKNRK